MKQTSKYGFHSNLIHAEEKSKLNFSTDLFRPFQVSFQGTVKNSHNFRVAMQVLGQIVASDLKLHRKSRTSYFEWLETELERLVDEYIQKQKLPGTKDEIRKELSELYEQKSNLLSKLETLWPDFDKMEREFWGFIHSRDHALWMVLDPVITVHPDIVMFEAFSKDESTYANFQLPLEAFDLISEPQFGTTNVDFSAELKDAIQTIRSYNPLDLQIIPEGFTVDSGVDVPHFEKKIDLPESWIQGFLQVSSSQAIKGTNFNLTPGDMYNIIAILKRNKANESPRAIRFDLTPKKPIKIYFEPWNIELICSSVYTGSKQKNIRIWGRRRLLLVEGLLPITNHHEVTLLGPGLPFFIRSIGQNMAFTIGFSGWTANDWTNGALFSALGGIKSDPDDEILDYLTNNLVIDHSELRAQFDNSTKLKSTLAYLYRKGLGIYDVVNDKIRYRELSSYPLPNNLTDPTDEEKKALDLVDTISNFSVVKEVDKKTEIRGDLGNRNLSIQLNDDGIITKGNCNCSKIYTHKLLKGPCEHLLALFLRYDRNDE